MLSAIIAAAVIFVVLVSTEWLYHLKKIRGEAARKMIHIIVGVFVAFWPYFMSWREIILVSLAMLLVILVSHRLKFFKSIHNVVERKTWGEILFPIGIGLAAYLTPNRLIFTAAMLHLAVADGLAAIVGKKWGKKNRFKVFGEVRSLVGTLTFWVISIVIVSLTVYLGKIEFRAVAVPLIIWLPLMGTALESLAIRGTDNVFIPVTVVLVLRMFQ